jgi:hypothetical protein
MKDAPTTFPFVSALLTSTSRQIAELRSRATQVLVARWYKLAKLHHLLRERYDHEWEWLSEERAVIYFKRIRRIIFLGEREEKE